MHIITAAHCLVIKKVEVQVGSSIAFKYGRGQIISVDYSIPHPDYSEISSDNDIGVIVLKNKIRFNINAKPIALYLDELPIGAWSDVTGFGRHYHGSYQDTENNKLMHIKLQIMSNERCNGYYRHTPYTVTDNMFCAGFLNGEGDTCQGDSGGPVVVDGKLVGVVSWGLGCAKVGFPGVYTNIRRMKEFIKLYIPIWNYTIVM